MHQVQATGTFLAPPFAMCHFSGHVSLIFDSLIYAVFLHCILQIFFKIMTIRTSKAPKTQRDCPTRVFFYILSIVSISTAAIVSSFRSFFEPTDDFALSLGGPTTDGLRLVGSTCFVTAVANFSARSEYFKVHITRQQNENERDVICTWRSEEWSSEANACQGSPKLTDAPACDILREATSFERSFTGLHGLAWSDEHPDALFLRTKCWQGGEICAPFSQSQISLIATEPNSSVSGSWHGTSNDASVTLQTVQNKMICVSVLMQMGYELRTCGGCIDHSFNGKKTQISPRMSFECSTGSAISLWMRIIHESLRVVYFSSPTGGGDIDANKNVSPPKVFLTPAAPELLFQRVSWVCSLDEKNKIEIHLNEKSGRDLVVSSLQSRNMQVSAKRCSNAPETWSRARRAKNPIFKSTTHPIKTSCFPNDSHRLVEDSDTGQIWRISERPPAKVWKRGTPQLLSALSAGLWTVEPGHQLLLDAANAVLWSLSNVSGTQKCHALHQPQTTSSPLSPGAWAAPEARPFSCPRGANAAQEIEVTNAKVSFFYQPAACRKRLGSGYKYCDCPWKWSRANETAIVDGAAILSGCGLMASREVPLSSWSLRGSAPSGCSLRGSVTIEIESRGIPGACASDLVCSASETASTIACENAGENNDNALHCRSCPPGRAFFEGRCFEMTPEVPRTTGPPPVSRAEDAPTLTAPSSPGGHWHESICASETDIEAHEIETARLAPFFLPVVRGQLRAFMAEQGAPPEIMQYIGQFVGVPWLARHDSTSWRSGFRQTIPNAPLGPRARNRGIQNILPDSGRELLQRIMTGIRRPLWKGAGTPSVMWEDADLEFVIVRPEGTVEQGVDTIFIVRRMGAAQSQEDYVSRAQLVLTVPWSNRVLRASWMRLIDGSIQISIINSRGWILEFNLFCDTEGQLCLVIKGLTDAVTRLASLCQVRSNTGLEAHWMENVVIEPTSGPPGCITNNRMLESSLIIGRTLAAWTYSPNFGFDDPTETVPIAFVTNLLYLTSSVADMSPPRYVFDIRRYGNIRPNIIRNDWRAYYSLIPQTSLWLNDGKLIVVFLMKCHDPSTLLSGFLRNLNDRNAYIIVEFERKKEHVDVNRMRREQRAFFVPSGLNDMPAPPTRRERLSDAWMCPVGWQFFLSAFRSSGSTLQEVPGKGVLLWQTPDPSRERSVYIADRTAVDATNILGHGSVHVSCDSTVHWFSFPFPSARQVFHGMVEPTLQENIIPQIPCNGGASVSEVSTMQDGGRGSQDIARLVIITRPAMNRMRFVTPMISFASLRIRGGSGGALTRDSGLHALPLPERDGKQALDFDIAVASLGYLWRSATAPRTLEERLDHMQWRGTEMTISEMRASVATLESIERLGRGISNRLFESRQRPHPQLLRAASGRHLRENDVWVLERWRIMRFVTSQYLPTPNGRVEYKIDADKTYRDNGVGYITLRARKPVLVFQGGTPRRRSVSKQPAELVAGALLNSLESTPVGHCFLCRNTLGAGRPLCPVCEDCVIDQTTCANSWLRWPRFFRSVSSARPSRVNTPIKHVLVRDDVSVGFEDLGEFSLALKY